MSRIRLFRIGQTTVDVEPTFLFLIALFVILDIESQRPIHEALLWIPILLISVLFHEFGHAASIRLFGYGSSEIILSGLGGVTLNRRPLRPLKEVVISAAGPIFSFLLAMVAVGTLRLVPFTRTDPLLAAFLPQIVKWNIIWGIFNLVPVFPLDGGQIVKNMVRVFTREVTSVRVSAASSLLFAIVLLAAGLWARQPFLAIISAMFAWQNWQRLQTPASPPPDHEPGP